MNWNIPGKNSREGGSGELAWKGRRGSYQFIKSCQQKNGLTGLDSDSKNIKEHLSVCLPHSQMRCRCYISELPFVPISHIKHCPFWVLTQTVQRMSILLWFVLQVASSAKFSGALERQPEPISLKDMFKWARLSYSMGNDCLSGIKF